MNKKLIIRISNELGNQMFMYAAAYSISKKLDRKLYIDNETAFLSKKNISKYGLGNFDISSKTANKEDKFLGLRGYLRKKIFKFISNISKKKIFFVEPKNSEKITCYNDDIYNQILSKNHYIEGYFESEKYFKDIKNEILKEFTFINSDIFKKTPHYIKLNLANSVSICLRQDRFIEGKGKNNPQNKLKSEQFRDEQINYINKSINYIKKTVENPTFYLWSNDLSNVDMSLFNAEIQQITHTQDSIFDLDNRALDLFLISQCNHHIVIPSSFNWWGAWLCVKKDKIICRPDADFFSFFKVNNLDFWPSHWIKIS